MWFPSVRTLRLPEPSSSAASLLLPSNESRAGHILSLPATASLPLSHQPKASASRDKCGPGLPRFRFPDVPVSTLPQDTQDTPRSGQRGHILTKDHTWPSSSLAPECSTCEV